MRRLNYFLAVVLAAVVWQGCQSTPPRASFTFRQEKLTEIDSLLEQGMAEHRMPGAVLWIEHDGVAYHKAIGQRALVPVAEPMTEDTIFDAASLTKVLATTPSIMLLAERGEIDLDAPVQKYIEEFRRDGKDVSTIRQLLTHTSGLRAGLSREPEGSRSAIAIACQEKLINPPGTHFLYSDINFILLGEVVQRVSGRPLAEFARDEIYRPLKMKDTRFLPWSIDRARIAPTQWDGTNMLRGVVHDPRARHMEGVAGHAGVFTTAADVARFARMMLNGGTLDDARIFRPETIAAMTSVQSPATMEAKRGFGWDIDTGYSRRGKIFPIGSYGHTGFTGTALWIDPFSKTFWVLMTNRVHPDNKGDIRSLQSNFSTLVAEATDLKPLIASGPATNVSAARR